MLQRKECIRFFAISVKKRVELTMMFVSGSTDFGGSSHGLKFVKEF